MTLNVGKRACLEEWAGRVLKKDVSLIEIRSWSLYFELLDKAFERRPKGALENKAESVIDRLNDFFTANFAELIGLQPDLSEMSDFAVCCTMLLILTVGLRINPKVFMDAAFKLPSSLHVDVVQMVKPLIEANSVSLSSFDTLLSFPASLSSPECTRFDQLPSFPLTCPPASRPDRLSDLSVNKFDENSQPTLSDSVAGFVTPFHRTLPSSVTKMRRYMTPDNIKLGAEFTSTGSPLCSLQNILESPQMAQKNLLVSKLDEIRSLKLKLAEQRDLCEELQNENCRLEKSAVDSDRRIAELELRVRAKETELTDLRDEAEEAKFLRTEKENLERQNSRLRELLESANEKVKSLKYVQEDNENLLRENGELESLVKNLQSQAGRSASYERLNSQYQQVRAALETAEHTILEFVKERESFRAASEAEARVLRSTALKRVCGGTPTSHNQCTCTCHHSANADTSKPEPTPFTETDSPPVDSVMEVSICRDAHLGSGLDISYSGGEVMSEALAADKCLQELESKTAELSAAKASLMSAQSEIAELRKEAKRERLKSLFRRALESHRLSILEIKIKAKDEVLSGLENEMESVHSMLQSKERELAAAMVRVENLENDLASVKEEGDSKATRWSEQRRQLTEEIQRSKQQLQARESNLIGQMQQAKVQHQTELSELQFQVEQLKGHIASLSHEHTKELSSLNNKLTSERANFDGQVASLCSEKEALIHELQEATISLSTARDETLRLDAQAKELEVELVRTRGQVASLSDRLTVSADNTTRLEAELAVCKKRLAEAVAQNGEDAATLSNAQASCINNLRASLMSAEQREAEARHEASMARFACETTEKENARLMGRIAALETRLDTEAEERLGLEDRLAKEAVRWHQLQGACQEQEALVASLKHQVETLTAQKEAAEEAHRASMLRHLQAFYAAQEAEERVAMLECCSRKQSAYSLEHLHKYSTSLTDAKSRGRDDHASVPALGHHSELLNMTTGNATVISDLRTSAPSADVGFGIGAPPPPQPVLRVSSTPSALAAARQSPRHVVVANDEEGDAANTTESEEFAPITELIEPQTEELHTSAAPALPLEQFCNSPLFDGDQAQFNRLSSKSPICLSSQGPARLESPSPTSISSAIYSETFDSSPHSAIESPKPPSLAYAGSSKSCSPVSVGTVVSISPYPDEVCLTANYVTYKNLSVADYAASVQINHSEKLRSSPLASDDLSPVPSVHAFPYVDCTAAVSPQKDHRLTLPVTDELQLRRIQRLLLLPAADEDSSCALSLEAKTLSPKVTVFPCTCSPGTQVDSKSDLATSVSFSEKAPVPSVTNDREILPTSQVAVDSPNNLTTQVTAQSFGPLQYHTLPARSLHRPVPNLTIEQMKAYQVTINKSNADMPYFKKTDSSLSLASIPTAQIPHSPPKLARFHSALELTRASADSISLVSDADSAKMSRVASHRVGSGTPSFRRLKERFRRSRHQKSKRSGRASFTAGGPESPASTAQSAAAYPPLIASGDGPAPFEAQDHNGSLVSGKSVKSQSKFHLPIIFGKKSTKASKKENTKPIDG